MINSIKYILFDIFKKYCVYFIKKYKYNSAISGFWYDDTQRRKFHFK